MCYFDTVRKFSDLILRTPLKFLRTPAMFAYPNVKVKFKAPPKKTKKLWRAVIFYIFDKNLITNSNSFILNSRFAVESSHVFWSMFCNVRLGNPRD